MCSSDLGSFYPKGMRSRDFLSYYSTQFATVEVDSTFYGTPSASTVSSWNDKTPPDFTFAVKVPQICGDKIYVVHVPNLHPWRDVAQFERYISLGRGSVSDFGVTRHVAA